ncbi:MAG: FkbM family methyltransferase [Scytonematopsis contorta HA4267-MV1]|jgi:FkbM family methyltransferase|nr:FkbM family methyltransferase [Scytonematopsis contorta HA4267-MV1]
MDSKILSSELNHLIPAEIKNDELYNILNRIATKENIKTFLEIGSSSGEGSTEALVTGLRQNKNQPMLFCMEISTTRFAALQKNYENDSFVKCYNVSSVSLDKFPNEKEIVNFYTSNQTNLNLYPLTQVLGWLQQDIDYVKNSGVTVNGIKKIKEDNNIDDFDFVLIDGSEFTGFAELEEVYGAKFICLDDINTFKNYQNHYKLLSDTNYVKIAENRFLRNGYSIFQKVNNIDSYFFNTETTEQLLLSKLIRPGMTVFDVGANIGDYSILLSKLVRDSGKVYSFEPTSNIFNQLQQRLSQSKCNNVNAFSFAIYSENTQIEFNQFPEEYSAWNSLGKPEMLNPNGSGEYVPIVNSEIVKAISLDSFCEEHDIKTIDYLKIDVEGAESDVLQGTTKLLSKKAIQFIQFEISQKMLEGFNRSAKSTFDILKNNGYECHRITRNGEIGEKIYDSNSFYENYIAFPSLPINFFTIVLNGEPFIRYHIDVFKQLPFKWHWHIVEGVADLKHDTAWSVRLGGYVSDEIHRNGHSYDSTKEYLDELAQLYPDHITIYRKPEGIFWDGKREMVNAPLVNIQEECLLWQVDVDELWTVEQVCTTRQIFINNPEKTAAFYWCWYFVGENLVISTRNCYAQNPQQEWLRTWKFKPGAFWAAHEPPLLVESLPDGKLKNIAAENPFSHDETEQFNLIFQHFAYVTSEQLCFKEQYYGYQNAVSQWQELQKQTKFPVCLREYFAWVADNTQVDTANSMGIVPIAQRNFQSNQWRFLRADEIPNKLKKIPIVIVDGVFFQLYQTGIARVWKSLLEEWANNCFAQHIIVLDRAGTAPKIPGIRYCTVPAYDYNNTDADRAMLQQVCDAEEANVFISSYYTTPITTPSVFLAYDMIPEVMGWDMRNSMWQEKHRAIQQASSHMAISQNTSRDLVKYFPDIPLGSVSVAYCGVQSIFSPVDSEQITAFKSKYGINKPYFILVGGGSGYKNSILFFQAFAQLPSKYGFEIICTGSGGLLDSQFREYTFGCNIHMLQLSDEELVLAYSGALALAYPSKYEGFGMPIAEAIACGCPVITCPNASIPEVGGKSVIYVNDDDVEGMVNALCDVQKPSIRRSLITAGLQQVKQFSWSNMAKIVGSVLIDTTLLSLNLKKDNFIVFPDWLQPEELICSELELAIKAIANSLNSKNTTLLIDTSNISYEDAEMMLSAIMMSLLMQEDSEVIEELEISLVGELADVQWETLLTRIKAKIVLKCENQHTIASVQAEKLPSTEALDFSYS